MRKLVSVILGEIILCASVALAQEAQPATPAEGAVVAVVAEEQVGANVAVRQEAKAPKAENKPAAGKVAFNPNIQRDPMLSPDDIALLETRRRAAEAAKEAERLRRLEEERRRAEEAERLRQLELLRLKDPAREVRNKIRIGGIIDKEVFIGDKIYTVGNSIYGARIVEVRPEEVVFSYKGHTFIKRIPL